MDSAQAKALRDSLLGNIVSGWQIDSFHGYGKSAVVMGANRDGMRGAVKVFHPELIEHFGREAQLERIRRETSLIGFKHPNLIEILDGGACAESGFLFVVMEELDWKNLKDVLNEIPQENISSIIRDVALAARFLEDKALAHRDIKPENIAISPDYTSAKLLDLGVLIPFGITGLTDVDARPFIGTLRYSSPEFLRREEDPSPEGWRAISIYQIGAVLHDLLMKIEIFHDYSEPYSILVEAVQKQVPDVHGFDADLVRICKHSLVKSPKTRLDLVGWKDFIPQEDGLPEASLLHEKIKTRQRYFKEINDQIVLAGGEGRRLLKQNLEFARNSLDLKIAVLLTTLKYFPLHAIDHQLELESASCISIINFEKDKNLGLTKKFTIKLDLKLIDENSGSPIYQLGGSCYLLNEDVELFVRKFEEITAGSLSEIISDPKFETWLLSILESVYDVLDRQ